MTFDQFCAIGGVIPPIDRNGVKRGEGSELTYRTARNYRLAFPNADSIDKTHAKANMEPNREDVQASIRVLIKRHFRRLEMERQL